MRDASLSVDEIRSMRYDRQLDIICDRFEDEWKQGKMPDLRQLAMIASPEYQSRVLRELVVIEKECVEYHGNTGWHDNSSIATATSSMGGSTIGNASTSVEPGALPSHFDKFLIRRLIGRGAHGAVYEAEDVCTRRRVALKIADQESMSLNRTATFQSEAANTVRISHPSIVQIWEVGEKNGRAYIASEMVDGADLKTLLKDSTMSLDSVIRIVADIAAGIDVAHTVGVIHRDLKPSNILIERLSEEDPLSHTAPFAYDTGRYRVRIIDFGVSKYLDQTVNLTQIGDLVGTPHYMSPEQARGDSKSVDQRSDIFSLGVILFEMLTGELPFPGSPMVAIAAIRDTKAKSIRDIRPTLSPVLAKIVAICLERQPSNRYSSAKKLESDLREWLEIGTVESIRKQNLRRRLLGVVVTAAAIGFVWLGMLSAGTSRLARQGSVGNRSESNRVENEIPPPAQKLARWLTDGSPSELVQWLDVRQENPADMAKDFNVVLSKANKQYPWYSHLAEHLAKRTQLNERTKAELARAVYGSLEGRTVESWVSILMQCESGLLLELEIQSQSDLPSDQQALATLVLADVYSNNHDVSSAFRLFRNARTSQLGLTLNGLLAHPHESTTLLETEMASFDDEIGPRSVFRTREGADWCARLGLLSHFLGHDDIFNRVVGPNADPNAWISLVSQFQKGAFSPESMVTRLENCMDDWQSTAIASCIAGANFEQLSAPTLGSLDDRLLVLYKTHPSAGVHNALHDLLVQRGMHREVSELSLSQGFQEVRPDRNWYVNSLGMPMTIVRSPSRYWRGIAPKLIDAASIKKDCDLNDVVSSSGWAIMRNEFAISTYAIKRPSYSLPDRYDVSEQPIFSFDSAQDYCHWLSDRENLADPVRYRIPTRDEWDCAMKACHVKAVLLHNDERKIKALYHPFGVRLQEEDPLLELTSSLGGIKAVGSSRIYIVKPAVLNTSNDLFTSSLAPYLPYKGTFSLRYCRSLESYMVDTEPKD